MTSFCRGGGWELGAIVHFWPTWVCYGHPSPAWWSVVALHDLLLYIIRTHQELDDTGTQGACGLSPWLPGMGITAGFGCGDEFLGGVDGVTEVHLLPPRCTISAPPDRPGCRCRSQQDDHLGANPPFAHIRTEGWFLLFGATGNVSNWATGPSDAAAAYRTTFRHPESGPVKP